MLKENSVSHIRIAKFNNLVALYAKHKNGTLRICFGGKTIKQEDAYKTALELKEAIIQNKSDIVFQDDYRGPQQVAAFMDEANPM
jgi:hypothetical protein